MSFGQLGQQVLTPERAPKIRKVMNMFDCFQRTRGEKRWLAESSVHGDKQFYTGALHGSMLILV